MFLQTYPWQPMTVSFPCYKHKFPGTLLIPGGVVLSVLTQAFQAARPKTDLLSCLLWLFREVRRKKHWTGSSWLCARGLGLHPSHHGRYCQLPHVSWACRHVELWHRSCMQFALSLLCMGGADLLYWQQVHSISFWTVFDLVRNFNRKSILLASCGCQLLVDHRVQN